MVKDGYYYGLGLLVTAGVAWYLMHSRGMTGIIVLLALFFLWFFRDPNRTIPTEANLAVSPADGKVTECEWIQTEQGGRLRISIFLSVFDVHVNRTPIAGTVTGVEYRKGGFMNAMNPECVMFNEQTLVVVNDGRVEVAFKLIAGLLARRIVCNVQPGDILQRGQRIGLIKFGSRVDVLLPGDAQLMVRKGSRVKGGSSVLARLV
ncbi:MAG TPA: phosphatidylserine decarboxylase [Acidobacteriaceae bacterium]